MSARPPVDPELLKLLRNMHRGAAGLADNLKKLIAYLDHTEGAPPQTKH